MIGRFFNYLLGKKSEINDLDYKDAVLAQANLRIYTRCINKTTERVPLKYLKYVHPLDRDNSKAVLGQRVEALEMHKEQILEDGVISMDKLIDVIPSISHIKVVEANGKNFIAFEGNGRIAALKEVFGDREDLLVEVQQYHFRNKRPIIRKLNQLRKLNGLIS